jgi:hypothetical protein
MYSCYYSKLDALLATARQGFCCVYKQGPAQEPAGYGPRLVSRERVLPCDPIALEGSQHTRTRQA